MKLIKKILACIGIAIMLISIPGLTVYALMGNAPWIIKFWMIILTILEFFTLFWSAYFEVDLYE